MAWSWLESPVSTDNKIIEKAIVLERERITNLSELAEAAELIFKPPDYSVNLLVCKKNTKKKIKNILPKLAEFMNTISVQAWLKEKLEAKIGEWIAENRYSTGSVLWPMRAALSGQEKSPGPFEIAEVLGKEESLSRLQLAIKKLSN